MTALASAAFRLALRHMRVFPLAPGTKVPIAGSNGLVGASDDPDATRSRWNKTPNANIGIATGSKSGIWVLDVDAQHGGAETLATLEAEHGALPLTITVETPSGGRHLYFAWPSDGPEIRNSAGRVGPGIDVRGEGGCITAPPSVLRDGRSYRWIKNGASGFAAAPDWLIALALPPPAPPRPEPKPLSGDVCRYVAAAVRAELAALDQAQPGGRNAALNLAAFKLAQFIGASTLPEDWAAAELERRAVAIGLPAQEARATIASAFAAGLREPRELTTHD
ncbi:MAG: bifunctional DNA primase/polymerase [Hyphomicrobium sp.]|uniref:bifunctional DNA primase/polymerase n=1 Tax=Hyphomicrobium sp. TaxID=82 RepID=UPI003D0A89F9